MTKYELLLGLRKAAPIIKTVVSVACGVAAPIGAIHCHKQAKKKIEKLKSDGLEHGTKDILMAAAPCYLPVAAVVALGAYCSISSTTDLYRVIKPMAKAIEFEAEHADNWKAAATLVAASSVLSAEEALAKVKEKDIALVPEPQCDDYRMYFDVTNQVWARMRPIDFERARYMLNGLYAQFGHASVKSFYSHADALMSDHDWDSLHGRGITQTDDFIDEYCEYSYYITINASDKPCVIDEGEYAGLEYYEIYWWPGTHYDEDLFWMEADCDLVRKERLGQAKYRSPRDKRLA